jgi:hypothetical protein
MQAVANQLAGAMAAKTDAVLKEAVTRFLGRTDWTLDELKGRCVTQRWPNGIEEFCIDGVAIAELHPIQIKETHESGSTVMHVERQHRFLLHNA